MAEIYEFLKQVLADQREMDADPTPQTPPYALLAAGRLEEAEAAACQTVSDLEKENASFGNNLAVVQSKNLVTKNGLQLCTEQNQTAGISSQLSLLAEALIAHGVTLARLKKLEAAQASLERAIAVAQEAGATDKAGKAALTMIEELDELSQVTLLRAYEQASASMAQMRNRKLQWRVIDAAKKVMANLWGEMDPDRALEILLARPLSSHVKMVRYESALINRATVEPENCGGVAGIVAAGQSVTGTGSELAYPSLRAGIGSALKVSHNGK